jgi:hypothetical protein
MPEISRDSEGKYLRDDSALALAVAELGRATIAGIIAALENPPNMERASAAIQRIEDVIEQAGTIDPAGGEE